MPINRIIHRSQIRIRSFIAKYQIFSPRNFLHTYFTLGLYCYGNSKTNICPQIPELNRGRWKELEEQIREWVQRDSALLITCGPIVSTPRKTIGRHEIVVPARFFKVVAVPYTGTPRGIAFIFDNEAEQPSLKELAITIDSVERVTGIDFFHNLPDSIEHKIESDLSLEIWNLN